MVTYLVTFGFILLILFSSVIMHMSLGLNRAAKKAASSAIVRTPHLHDILFRDEAYSVEEI